MSEPQRAFNPASIPLNFGQNHSSTHMHAHDYHRTDELYEGQEVHSLSVAANHQGTGIVVSDLDGHTSVDINDRDAGPKTSEVAAREELRDSDGLTLVPEGDAYALESTTGSLASDDNVEFDLTVDTDVLDSTFADLTGHKQPSVATTQDSLAVVIPDDLDDTDFDIDASLEAEFAALETSFVVSDEKPSQYAQPAPSSAAEYPMKDNPYLPSARNVSSSIVSQEPAGLFTPAQLDPRNTTQIARPAFPLAAAQTTIPPPAVQSRMQAPSYVSGKVAYQDPYALPDALVAKKRARPQSQLRSAMSVPDLKAPRPYDNQRRVSNNVYQAAPGSMHTTPLSLGSEGRSGTIGPSTHSGSMNHDKRPPAHQTQYKPQSFASQSQGRQPSPNVQAQAQQTTSYPIQPRAVSNYVPSTSLQQISYDNPSNNNTAPSNRASNNMTQYTRQSSLHNAGLADPRTAVSQDNILQSLSLEPVLGHARHVSSSSYSARSEVSEPVESEHYKRYLQDEKQAEQQMFSEAFRVAEFDIREAQSLQRTNASNVAESSLNRFEHASAANQGRMGMPVDDSEQKFIQAESQGLRHRVEQRPQERPPAKYASTEPSGSPRNIYTRAPEAYEQRPTTSHAPHRPAQLTRAVSSFHDQQAFQTSLGVLPGSSNTEGTEGESTTSSGAIGKFAFGGKLITCVPKYVPRFSAQGTMVQQIAGSGPVCIRISPLPAADAMLAEFPGPLTQVKSSVKQRKADIQAWLQKNIASDSITPDLKLLWSILLVMVANDGNIGSPSVKTNIVQLLCPELDITTEKDTTSHFRLAKDMTGDMNSSDDSEVLTTQTITLAQMTKLSNLLLRGDHDNALRCALDNSLWAHAFLIASKMPAGVWSMAIREFTAAELSHKNQDVQSLRALYDSIAGSETAPGRSDSSLSGSQNWRQALVMLLNNRNSQDDAAIISLGASLLSSRKVLQASICFITCLRPILGFAQAGGPHISLLGYADLAHDDSQLDFGASMAATEIYEFANSLANPKSAELLHLLEFKLAKAKLLADMGAKQAAKRYCDNVANTLKLLPKAHSGRSSALNEELKEFAQRLDALSNDEIPSWIGTKIGRSNMDNLWGSFEGKFNKFVAGDSEPREGDQTQSTQSPFARLVQTPNLSRAASSVNLQQPAYSTANNNYSKASPYEALAAQPSAIEQTTSYRPAPSRSGSYAMYEPQRPFTPPTQQTMQPGQVPFEIQRQSSSAYAPAAPQPRMLPASSQPGLYKNPAITPYSPADGTNFSNTVSQAQQMHTFEVDSVPDRTYEPPAQYSTGSIVNSNQTPADFQAPELLYKQDADQIGPGDTSHDSVENSRPPIDKQQHENSKSDQETVEHTQEKKGGWLGGWFGGGNAKKKDPPATEAKVHKAKLGEGMSLVYDPVSKKWVNPKGEMPEEKSQGPPPPPTTKRAPKPPSSGPTSRQATPKIPNTQINNFGDGSSLNDLATAPRLPPIGRKLASAEDDLAAMLGGGPMPRRAASGPALGGVPTGSNGGATLPRTTKKGKPAKKYVDVFQG